ncbi:MAG TPA: fasciclin domain-containing protein, partial [Allosphingosinicella sp.]
GTVTADDLGRAIERGKGKAQLATVGGSNLSFSREGGSIVVTDAAGGRARVAGAEGHSTNGVVHSVDGVLRGR